MSSALRDLTERFANTVVLAHVGTVKVYTYGVLMGLAYSATYVFVCLYLFAVLTPELAHTYCQLLCRPCIVWAIVGGRLMSVLLEDGLVRTIQEPSLLLRRGFWLHGCLVGIVATCVLQCRWHRPEPLDPMPVLDAIGVGLLLFEVLNRLGCLCYGCCWGRATDGPLGILYTNPDAAVHVKHSTVGDRRLHPVQLYASVLYATCFAAALVLLRLGAVAAVGDLFAASMLVWGGGRLLLEHFRADFLGPSALVSTGTFTLIQMALGLALLAYDRPGKAPFSVARHWSLGVRQIVDGQELLFTFIVPFLVYGVKSANE